MMDGVARGSGGSFFFRWLLKRVLLMGFFFRNGKNRRKSRHFCKNF